MESLEGASQIHSLSVAYPGNFDMCAYPNMPILRPAKPKLLVLLSSLLTEHNYS